MIRATLTSSLVLLVLILTWSYPEMSFAQDRESPAPNPELLTPDYLVLPPALIAWICLGGSLIMLPELIGHNLGFDPHDPAGKMDVYEVIKLRLNGGESGFNTAGGDFIQ